MGSFAKGFLWGSSTNAQQFEGGWNEGGKGASISDVRNMPTDTITAPDFEAFKTGSDHYHHLEEDIALFGEMGFSVYRFTIAWSRIYPTGLETEPNEEGLAFYDRMLAELEKYNIQPAVTLYAYDMPNKLSTACDGWKDRSVVDAYMRYARMVITRFKGRVKFWIPFNEQNMIVMDSEYMTGYRAKNDREQFCIEHNFALAWALCTRLVHEIDPEAQVGGNLAGNSVYPETCNPADVMTCDLAMGILSYGYADLFCRKEYSPLFLNRFSQVDVSGIIEDGDMDIIRSAEPDFLSLSYYMSLVASAKALQSKNPFSIVANPYTTQTEWGWNIDPYGFRHCIEDYWHRYQMPILISENGLGCRDTMQEDGSINDDYRIEYLANHIEQMAKAVESGAKIIGYMTWSAIDLYSTREGFEKRYGFVYVNKSDLSRTPKKSFYWFKKVIRSNGGDLSTPGKEKS